MKKLTLLAAALFLMLIPTEILAQDCPSAYTNNGGRIRFTWSGTRPTGITQVQWTDATTYTGANSGGSAWRTDNTSINPTGTETGTIIFTYSGGTYHCNISGGALPIELMYFKGQVIDGVTVLSWATASEQNNSHFTVERSNDNTNWEVVTVINGAGNSINTLKYEAKDYTPVNGTVYYRLRQDDYNGDYTYANTLALKNINNTKLNIMGLYIENNTLKVSLEGNSQEEPVTVRIYSLVGSVERSETINFTEFDNNMVNLDVSNLNGGIYTITITQGNVQSSGKFIK